MSIQHPDKRVRRTKEKFHEVLLSLMEEKSFADITITEIVKAADFNRGTFYAHYEQKEDLLEEIIEDMFKKMTEAYREPYLNLSVVDFNEIPSSSIILFDHFLENKRFYKLMLSPKTTYNFHEKLIKRLDKLFREEFDFLTTEIDPNIDIQLFSTYRIHGIIGLILEWIENDFTKSTSYMGDQLIRILKFYTPKIYIKKKNDKE
ncbi:TetR/AcrR family transcriptional regulator [Neobacillus kokaensis]|uniref:TetR family transcriptional regulator n=1 Tax=Neobacillus kokaensis TaxID=2759023 RepID=A0ABQ3N7N9_9BACI|nr:TetR/AcrR family transcriptional regulator [Neobacillus kokaensis]GHI00057.1 TetR family transcriptional regulator [Neobacillus kokaensis]